jgi:hypothetical protein
VCVNPTVLQGDPHRGRPLTWGVSPDLLSPPHREHMARAHGAHGHTAVARTLLLKGSVVAQMCRRRVRETQSGRGEQRKVWTSWPQSVEVEARRLLVQRCTGCAAGGHGERENAGQKKSVVGREGSSGCGGAGVRYTTGGGWCTCTSLRARVRLPSANRTNMALYR